MLGPGLLGQALRKLMAALVKLLPKPRCAVLQIPTAALFRLVNKSDFRLVFGLPALLAAVQRTGSEVSLMLVCDCSSLVQFHLRVLTNQRMLPQPSVEELI